MKNEKVKVTFVLKYVKVMKKQNDVKIG